MTRPDLPTLMLGPAGVAMLAVGWTIGAAAYAERTGLPAVNVAAVACVHADPVVRVYGHPGGTSARDCDRRGSLADWKRAMGIDWMTAAELAQAIPPAYCEHVGQLLLAHLNDNAPAAATAGA